ncbi:MAG: hypothetical protein H0X24_02650 [Ktedonobacterales bacterium]|nr:hypothetical protein [Ktedonobacterales bacterium]
MAFGSYEVGVIQRTPIPDIPAAEDETLAALAREAHDMKRERDRDEEITHPFTMPALVRLRHLPTLADAVQTLSHEDAMRVARLAAIQHEIDDTAFRLYDISNADRKTLEGDPASRPITTVEGEPLPGVDEDATPQDAPDAEGGAADEEDADAVQGADPAKLAADLISYCVGCAFGRWDVRLALASDLVPQLADPFAPLPVCAPATLVGPDGLPATRDAIVSPAWLQARPDAITLPPDGTIATPTIDPATYPLAIAWDGLLADDPGQPRDITAAVRAVLTLLYADRAAAIEAEACTLLGVSDLRTYLTSFGAFAETHIKRYSRSRRKAPIYWLLQSPRKHFTVWVYYHRLDRDLANKVLHLAQQRLTIAAYHLTQFQTDRDAQTGSNQRKLTKLVEQQSALVADLQEFITRMEAIIALDLTPDRNDGVALNVAPWHALTPWKEARTVWQALQAGKFTWSTISQQLHPRQTQ